MKSKNLLTTITITAACFAAFLVAFESMIEVPSWLQVMGRLHPLVVHFPVVLILLLIVYELLFKKQLKHRATANLVSVWLVLLSALSSVISVIAGIILSKEAGYDQDALSWHKWFGVAVTLFMLLWMAVQEKISRVKIFQGAFIFLGTALIIIAGHLGASVTHGEDYILAPVRKEMQAPVVAMEDALVYQHMVRPILQAKCINCHNTKKAKGRLVMDTEELLLKGGKNGKLWDIKEPDLGLLLRRVHLPLDQKKHMPPAGKPQLEEEEIEIISSWIRKGSDFKLHVKDLPATDTLYQLAQKMFHSGKEEVYAFDPADETTIEKLNSENRVVKPVALESPALDVSFYGASLFEQEQLEQLEKIKTQIVSLNMEKIPVTDAGLKTIAGFVNLRKLNLSFTGVTGKGLSVLSPLKNLHSLSLAGVPLSEQEVQSVCTLPNLRELYLWNTGLAEAGIASLQKKYGKLKIRNGYFGDTVVLQLNAPLIQNEERIIHDTLSLKLKHYVKGVELRYTLDGTEPDSSSSPVYNGRLLLNKNCTVKVKAFKKGWISSEIVETYFFRSAFRADSAQWVLPPDPSYKGSGAATLTDLVKADNNFRSGKWLGYKESKMEILLYFKTPAEVSSVTLSSLVDVSSYIMPAKNVKVYGGTDKNNLKLLGETTPEQPSKIVPAYQKGIDIPFKSHAVTVLKIVALPVNSLPSWHPGKGQKGWVFADEIFVN